MKEKVIVLRNREYLIDEIETNQNNQDTVLSKPTHNSNSNCVLKNTINIKWVNPYQYGASSYVEVIYNKEELTKIYLSKIEEVYSIITSFKDYTFDELDKLVENIKAKELSKFKDEIKALKNEKEFLLAEITSIKKLKKSIDSISLATDVFLANINEMKKDIENFFPAVEK